MSYDVVKKTDPAILGHVRGTQTEEVVLENVKQAEAEEFLESQRRMRRWGGGDRCSWYVMRPHRARPACEMCEGMGHLLTGSGQKRPCPNGDCSDGRIVSTSREYEFVDADLEFEDAGDPPGPAEGWD